MLLKSYRMNADSRDVLRHIGRWEPLLLENERLDLAVAHGAAHNH